MPVQYANKKWINQESLECMRERDQRDTAATINNTNEDWEIYKKRRNEVTSLLRRQDQNYYELKIDENKNDARNMWKTLKRICQNKNHSAYKEIQFGNEVIENELKIVEKFNEYFVGGIHNIIENIPKQNGYDLDIIEVKIN